MTCTIPTNPLDLPLSSRAPPESDSTTKRHRPKLSLDTSDRPASSPAPLSTISPTARNTLHNTTQLPPAPAAEPRPKRKTKSVSFQAQPETISTRTYVRAHVELLDESEGPARETKGEARWRAAVDGHAGDDEEEEV